MRYSGPREGEVILYWPNGRMKRRLFFKNGIRHGVDEIWSEEGVLVDTGEYVEGRPVGIHRRYGEDGRMIEEVEHFSDGTFRYWRPECTK